MAARRKDPLLPVELKYFGFPLNSVFHANFPCFGIAVAVPGVVPSRCDAGLLQDRRGKGLPDFVVVFLSRFLWFGSEVAIFCVPAEVIGCFLEASDGRSFRML